jgi:hypothetical protein
MYLDRLRLESCSLQSSSLRLPVNRGRARLFALSSSLPATSFQPPAAAAPPPLTGVIPSGAERSLGGVEEPAFSPLALRCQPPATSHQPQALFKGCHPDFKGCHPDFKGCHPERSRGICSWLPPSRPWLHASLPSPASLRKTLLRFFRILDLASIPLLNYCFYSYLKLNY